MREWIKEMLFLDGMLDKWCEKIERRIERIALNACGATHKLIDQIYTLNDFKLKLINMRVACDAIKGGLTNDELVLITGSFIGDECIRSTYYRRRAKVISHANEILSGLRADKHEMIKLTSFLSSFSSKNCKTNKKGSKKQHVMLDAILSTPLYAY